MEKKEVVGFHFSAEWVKNMCGLIGLQLLGQWQSGGKRGREGANVNLKNRKKKKKRRQQ